MYQQEAAACLWLGLRQPMQRGLVTTMHSILRCRASCEVNSSHCLHEHVFAFCELVLALTTHNTAFSSVAVVGHVLFELVTCQTASRRLDSAYSARTGMHII